MVTRGGKPGQVTSYVDCDRPKIGNCYKGQPNLLEGRGGESGCPCEDNTPSYVLRNIFMKKLKLLGWTDLGMCPVGTASLCS